MGADISRRTFDPARHYTAVVMQQGRVQLDADWNEGQEIAAHRVGAVTADAIGPSGAPNYAPGFALTPDSIGTSVVIGKGRFYIDGFLCENEDNVAYADQPDLLDPPALGDLLQKAGTNTAIVYLDVWQRHISALENPHIREQALGGPDTTARLKTVWQVRFLPVQVAQANQRTLLASLRRLSLGTGEYRRSLANFPAAVAQVQGWESRLTTIVPAGVTTLAGEQLHALEQALPQLRREVNGISRQTGISAAAILRELGRLDTEAAKAVQGVTCNTAFDEWTQLTAPSTSLLTPRLDQAAASTGPCDMGSQSGTGVLENQLYRVEVHRAGELTNPPAARGPTFKWSRDNGSVVTGVTAISGAQVTVASLGLDDVTGLAAGQWVEVLDDRIELAEAPGQLVQIASIDPATLVVTMKQPVVALTTDAAGVNPTRHPKLRRWDQQGDDQGLPIDLQPAMMEGMLGATFSAGSYRSGEHWLVPARADSLSEWPPFVPASAPRTAQPPLGVAHHYCRLGLVELGKGGQLTIHDCRRIFAPLSAPAMRVVATNWENDLPFSLTRIFGEGLRIWFDAEPFPQSLSSASVIVTFELSTGNQMPKIATVLDGEVSVSGNLLRWWPSVDQLRFAIITATSNGASIASIRLRLTLKGHVIHSDQDLPILHLDGQAFGRARPPGSVAMVPTTMLSFPTGAGSRASDFESWFYLLDDLYGYGYGTGSDTIGGHLI